MPKELTHTKDVSLLRLPVSDVDNNTYAEAVMPGDGSCGVHVVSSQILAMIRSGTMPPISKDKFQEFVKALKESNQGDPEQSLDGLRELYLHSNKKEIVPLIDAFKAKFLNPNEEVTFAKFAAFAMSQTSRLQIMALMICLAPALRRIAIQENAKRHANLDSASLKNREHLDIDKLHSLCQFFDVDLQVLVAPDATTRKCLSNNPNLPKLPARSAANRPRVIAIHRGNHFNHAIPQEELQHAHHPWHALLVEPLTEGLHAGKTHTSTYKELTKKLRKLLAAGAHSEDEEKKKAQIDLDGHLAKVYETLLNERGKESEASLLDEALEIALEEVLVGESLFEMETSKDVRGMLDRNRVSLDRLGFFHEHSAHASDDVVMEEAAPSLG